MRQWVFTSDEFSYVWEVETGQDRRPYPLDLAPRGTTTTESEHVALRLAERFPFNADPELTSTLRFLARTDVTTLSLFGDRFYDGQPQPDPILALGAAFGEWGAAAIATGEKVSVVSCKARTVIRQLADAMGSVPAGGLDRMKEPREAVLFPPPGQWQETDASRRATWFRQALRRPIDARRLSLNVPAEQEALETWLAANPSRPRATWTSNANKALIWEYDRQRYSPSGLVSHMWELAGWDERPVSNQGTARWITQEGETLAHLAERLLGNLAGESDT